MNTFDRSYFDKQIKYLERQINYFDIRNNALYSKDSQVWKENETVIAGMRDRLNNLIIFSRMI